MAWVYFSIREPVTWFNRSSPSISCGVASLALKSFFFQRRLPNASGRFLRETSAASFWVQRSSSGSSLNSSELLPPALWRSGDTLGSFVDRDGLSPSLSGLYPPVLPWLCWPSASSPSPSAERGYALPVMPWSLSSITVLAVTSFFASPFVPLPSGESWSASAPSSISISLFN